MNAAPKLNVPPASVSAVLCAQEMQGHGKERALCLWEILMQESSFKEVKDFEQEAGFNLNTSLNAFQSQYF